MASSCATVARFVASPAAQHRASGTASTSIRASFPATLQSAGCARRCQEHGHSARRRAGLAIRTRTCAAAVEFADNSHLAFYEDRQPKLDIGMKHAKKLAKKIGKQKKSLVKLAEVVQMAPSVLQSMLAELDSALEQVQERVAQLKEETKDDSSSSSDSSDDDAGPRQQDDTDAALLESKLAERRTEQATAGASSAVVGAMVVETKPSGPPGRLFVCQGKACMKRGGGAVMEAVSARAEALGDNITVTPTGCIGQCKKGCAMRVKAGSNKPELISRVGEEHVDDVFEYAFNVRPSDYVNF